MAKPHHGPGKRPGKARSRATFIAGAALLAAVSSATAAEPPGSFDQERRLQDRERVLREQLERRPDVRLPAPGANDARPAPEEIDGSETGPCFNIQTIELVTVDPLAAAAGDERRSPAPDFSGVLQTSGALASQGRCLGAQGISRLLMQVQNAVTAEGYVTTRVLAEPQDLSKGVLRLSVLPGRIAAVRLAGDSDGRAGLLTAFPMRPGDVLQVRDLEQALENLQRAPSARADIQIEPAAATGPGAQRGQSDLVVSYQQPMPFRLSVFADDSGTRETGKYQGGVTLSYDNALTLNDLFYVSMNSDLGGGPHGARAPFGTRGHVVHYSLPLGPWSLGTTVSHNRYAQSVAGLTQNIVFSGTSDNAEVKLTRMLHRDGLSKTTASLKAWQRRSRNFVDDTEVQVQRRATGGWEAGLGHRRYLGAAVLEGNVAWRRGTGAFGSHAAPEEGFGEGTSRSGLLTANASLHLPFKLGGQSATYRTDWRYQMNRTALTPQDRFAIGGRYTVRGFDGNTSLVAERGWLVQNELSTALGASGHVLYVGLDHGRVGGPSSAQLVGTTLTGAVIGWRGQLGRAQFDVFMGAPVHRPKFFHTASTTFGVSLGASF
jgi:hemolysin activation/secretion protein